MTCPQEVEMVDSESRMQVYEEVQVRNTEKVSRERIGAKETVDKCKGLNSTAVGEKFGSMGLPSQIHLDSTRPSE